MNPSTYETGYYSTPLSYFWYHQPTNTSIFDASFLGGTGNDTRWIPKVQANYMMALAPMALENAKFHGDNPDNARPWVTERVKEFLAKLNT